MDVKKFFSSKTNWTAIIAAITAASAYLTGEIDAVTAVQSVFGSLIAIFLRHNMVKGA